MEPTASTISTEARRAESTPEGRACPPQFYPAQFTAKRLGPAPPAFFRKHLSVGPAAAASQTTASTERAAGGGERAGRRAVCRAVWMAPVAEWRAAGRTWMACCRACRPSTASLPTRLVAEPNLTVAQSGRRCCFRTTAPQLCLYNQRLKLIERRVIDVALPFPVNSGLVCWSTCRFRSPYTFIYSLMKDYMQG